jgi:hypothetical protein
MEPALKKGKTLCGTLFFTNPQSSVEKFPNLMRKTVLQNLSRFLEFHPEYLPLLKETVTKEIISENVLIDNWYLDFKNGRLTSAPTLATSNTRYVGPNANGRPRWNGNIHPVGPNGRSSIPGQTPGYDSNPKAARVFIFVLVKNYITTTNGLHNIHLIGAFKRGDVLFCFNPWGEMASRTPTPDQQIWLELKKRYNCRHHTVYTGPNLQANDQVGACGVLSFTFGSHMYVDEILKNLNIIQTRNETFNAKVKRIFDTLQPAFGEVLTGLDKVHLQNQLTSRIWMAFHVGVENRKRASARDNSSPKRKGKLSGNVSPMNTNIQINRRKLVKKKAN